MEVGQALKVGREVVSNTGGTYQAKMAAWLKVEGFDSLDKGVRSRLLNIIDKLPEVQSWRETLSSADRLKYNHLNSIWRKYKGPPASGKKRKATNSPLALGDREELAKILGMLGSDNDGIVKNTASQATNFWPSIRSLGAMSWVFPPRRPHF